MSKKTIIPAVLSGLAISTAVFFSFSRGSKKILLRVDTEKINDGNIEDSTFFEIPKKCKNKDYITEVEYGEKIKWIVKKLNKNSPKVKLVKFKHEEKRRFFKVNTIPVNVFGNIKDTIKAGKAGDEEKYTLEIRVKNNSNGKKGSKWNYYSVDPKLLLTQN
ncbi:hypothetical protein [Christiangramia echinicola]|uniref:Uncharacterized protein n=1 Tax=Christiangramia echinicola TaxID=279359 RepID=A0A1H1M140_9FLAO|nr:hypothetical protein [Christiangramia echinicola]SDR80481.1 hypothetical protein SAMN04488552_1106 [Christiangramia echinicola]